MKCYKCKRGLDKLDILYEVADRIVCYECHRKEVKK